MKEILIKIVIILIAICGFVLSVNADVLVRGYYRKNGTYVKSHYRSDPDGNFINNWSTYPNINPYTGIRGTKRTPNYSNRYSRNTQTLNYSKKHFRNIQKPIFIPDKKIIEKQEIDIVTNQNKLKSNPNKWIKINEMCIKYEPEKCPMWQKIIGNRQLYYYDSFNHLKRHKFYANF